MNQTKPKLIAIVGPTATGKSDLAVSLAHAVSGLLSNPIYTINIDKKQVSDTQATAAASSADSQSASLANAKGIKLKCEVISADSRQIYCGLDIGTGKITEAEMQTVPHHMIDIADPIQTYSVSDYVRDGKKCIEEIFGRGHLPIICGGTGLYVDFLINNTELPNVQPDPKLREELEQKTIEELREEFLTLNNDQDHNVDLNNKRRLIRAIEILKSLGSIPKINTESAYDVLYIGLDASDEILKSRIATRLDKRLDTGMIEESEQLLAEKKLTKDRMHTLGLEYAFIADLLDENLSMADFKIKLNFAIWHYAKRQRTWFRRNKNINWFDISAIKSAAKQKSPTGSEIPEEILCLVRAFLKIN